MFSRLMVSNSDFKSQRLNESALQHATTLLQEHGVIWLENVFAPDFIGELAAAYEDSYVSQTAANLKKKHAIVGDNRLMVTVKLEPPFNTPTLYANPILSPLLDCLLGPGFTISSFGSVVTFPGADDQPIHFDHPPLFESEQLCSELPPHAITVVIPLVDIDESTGSTAVWEGSHRRVGSRKRLTELMEKPSWEDSVQPLPKRGDVYMMDYRLIHGGTANRCDHARPILYIVYSRCWFRDAFNFEDQPRIEFGPNEFKNVPKALRGMFAQHNR